MIHLPIETNFMKNYLILLLVSLALTTVEAQGLKYGIKAGLNLNSTGEIANLKTELSSIEDAKGAVSGFNIGFFGHVELAMLYVRPGIHFSKFETSFDALTVGKSRLEAPVSLGFKLLPIVSAFAGPTYRYELSKDNNDYSIESLKGDSTLGVHLGARVHLGKLGIDARIERGVSESEARLLTKNNIDAGVIDTRATVLSLGLSYSF